MSTTCRPRPTNPTARARRTRAAVAGIRHALQQTLAAEHPMTVRQVFYRLVSAGVIAKTETEYKATVVRLLTEMRLDGDVPYHWIADNTRWMRKPRTDSSWQAALRRTAETYRRALWDNQASYVEVWLEKDALAGVVYEVTGEFDVPLMVTRGYPSLSFLQTAAEAITATRKPAYLYYFGDYDPSGVDISRHTEARLRQLAPAAELHFERVAVQPWQVHAWQLPTRPTKVTDSRSKSFVGGSVEVDAIPPQRLRELVRGSIVQHLDGEQLYHLEQAEASEREVLARLLAVAEEWP